jgi:hypothetical protein
MFYLDHWSAGCPPNPSAQVVPGSWTYVCFGYDGSGVTSYWSSSGGVNSFLQTQYSWALSTMTIGSNTIGGSSTQPNNSGVLDEVSFWNRSLSMTEITALYSGGAGCHIH